MNENVIHLDLKKRLQDKFKNNPFWPFLLFFAVLFVLYLMQSMFYSVAPEENAVILQFGKYNRTEGPGLHFKLPYVPGLLPVEEAIKVPVRKIHKFETGYRTVSSGVVSEFEKNSQHVKDAAMLTGDLNVVDVEWVVQFQISDAKDFLFNVRSVGVNMVDISQSVMREVVGDRTVTEVLTTGTTEIEEEALMRMQKILNDYKMGIQIVTIKLQDVNPPESVKPSFNAVNSAKQEAEQAVNEAWKNYNTIIPEARGKAERSIADALGYKAQVVNQAIGDAKAFLAVYEEYKKAPDVSRQRLYFEKMGSIMQNAKSVTVIDPELKNVLPLLNIKGNTP